MQPELLSVFGARSSWLLQCFPLSTSYIHASEVKVFCVLSEEAIFRRVSSDGSALCRTLSRTCTRTTLSVSQSAVMPVNHCLRVVKMFSWMTFYFSSESVSFMNGRQASCRNERHSAEVWGLAKGCRYLGRKNRKTTEIDRMNTDSMYIYRPGRRPEKQGPRPQV